MPRFWLGSHPPQQQSTTTITTTPIDDDHHSNDSEQQQQATSVKSLWKRIRKSFSSSKKQNFPGLSPDRPPLPPILGISHDITNNNNNTHNHGNNNNNNNNNNGRSIFSSESNNGGGSSRFITRAKRIAPQTESGPTSSQRRHLRQSTGSIDDRTARLLYTILEESDTIMTDSTQSRARPQSLVFNDNNNNNNNNNNNHSNDEKRISTSSNETTDSSTSTTSSSAVSYHPPPVLPPSVTTTTTGSSTSTVMPTSTTQPKRGEPQFRPSMIGDETKCRRKFVKMVQAAYSFQMEHKDVIPKEMDILFNAQENVQSICLYMNGQPEYHKFCGNSQYIPPELSTHGTYNHDLADVWVLGISLYRMLVGKYPFIASTDRKLFKKMLSADFSIPSHLSEDAKDLLRRMLAPDTTRASLDLVLFHPWLKPYKVSVPSSSPVDHLHHSSQQQAPPPIITKTAPSSSTLHRTSIPPIPPLPLPSQDVSFDKELLTTPSSSDVIPPLPPQPSTSSSGGGNRGTIIPVSESTTTHQQDEKKLKRVLTSMMHLLVQGPYPPPKRPYQELAHLHTNHINNTNRPQRALAR